MFEFAQELLPAQGTDLIGVAAGKARKERG